MMRGCFTLVFLGFILLYLIMDDDRPEIEPKEEVVLVNPEPDPTREVFRFDWDKMRYVYKDELKPDSGTYRETGIMPDFYVGTIDEKSDTKKKYPQVVVKGKRYRVNNKPNGTMELIPIR
jgi:hypothetical protein